MASLRDLPQAKGERHVRAFKRFGWEETRVTRGSHRILEKDGCEATLSIPCGGKDVKRKLLDGQLKLAGISREDYIDAFK